MDNNEKIDRIRERITSSPSLSIARIPKKTLDWFIGFAKEEFCDDRGMAIKHLCDVYNGLIPSGIEHLESAIISLSERVTRLEDTPKEPEKKKHRLG
jgi:hypothetical protein